jgi:hypothetical protein
VTVHDLARDRCLLDFRNDNFGDGHSIISFLDDSLMIIFVDDHFLLPYEYIMRHLLPCP